MRLALCDGACCTRHCACSCADFFASLSYKTHVSSVNRRLLIAHGLDMRVFLVLQNGMYCMYVHFAVRSRRADMWAVTGICIWCQSTYYAQRWVHR